MTIKERKEAQAARQLAYREVAKTLCSPQGLVFLFPQMEKLFKQPDLMAGG